MVFRYGNQGVAMEYAAEVEWQKSSCEAIRSKNEEIGTVDESALWILIVPRMRFDGSVDRL